MAKDIQKQLEELTATVAVLANVVGNLMTVTPELTAPATTPKGGRKAAPKGSKGRKAKAVRSPNERTGYAGNIAAFGEALGVDLEGWVLQDILDALRAEDGQVGDLDVAVLKDGLQISGMPEGWTFGPASLNYLATGEWG